MEKCNCLTCKKIFFVKRYRVKQGRGKYCSRICIWKSKSWLENLSGKAKKRNYKPLLGMFGFKHPSWKGGKSKSKEGYVLVYSGKEKYEREHRILMEKKLGRKLEKWEQVHHKNGMRDDNRLSNLEIVVASRHFGQVRCPHCLKKFKVK
jgi:hypothetical protein